MATHNCERYKTNEENIQNQGHKMTCFDGLSSDTFEQKRISSRSVDIMLPKNYGNLCTSIIQEKELCPYQYAYKGIEDE